MANTVGEFFVNIGVKGSGEAFKALGSIKNALTDMSAQGIAAKAAVLGAVYALEQWTQQSANYGNNLQNFNTLTGIATTSTQQLAEAIREVTHVSRGEATGSAEQFLKSFQEKISAWQIQGRQHGSLMAQFAATAGFDVNTNDPLKWFAAIQKFSQHPGGLDIGKQNAILESFGVSPAIIETARKFAGDISKITRNIEGPGTVAANAKVAGQWSDFWTRLDLVRDKLTAKWGLPVIEELNKALTITLKWEESLERVIGHLAKLGSWFLTDTNGWGALKSSQNPGPAKTSELPSGIDIYHMLDKLLSPIPSKGISPEKIHSLPSGYQIFENINKALSPKQHSSTINIHQTNHGLRDAKEVLEPMAREIGLAMYSIPSIGQVA